MNNELMFSSATDMWATPQNFFNKLDAFFKFELDVCATSENSKCRKYFTETDDGLKKDWFGTVWMNPPYGREIGKWVARAYDQSRLHGSTIVCLLPARTDTKWWHDYCVKGEITFIKGRLKFGDAKNSAPFPSAVVIFRPTVAEALNAP
jgi:phage N-6-adenine-methyltransferase